VTPRQRGFSLSSQDRKYDRQGSPPFLLTLRLCWRLDRPGIQRDMLLHRLDKGPDTGTDILAVWVDQINRLRDAALIRLQHRQQSPGSQVLTDMEIGESNNAATIQRERAQQVPLCECRTGLDGNDRCLASVLLAPDVPGAVEREVEAIVFEQVGRRLRPTTLLQVGRSSAGNPLGLTNTSGNAR
jgi:hypothetical protein